MAGSDPLRRVRALPVFDWESGVIQRLVAPRERAAHLLPHAVVRQLAPATADLYGAGRMIII
jgi:hypothetical protein